MDIGNLIMILILMVRRSSLYHYFTTSEAFKVFDRWFLRQDSNLLVIIRRCVEATFFMRNTSNVKKDKVFAYRTVRRDSFT